MDDASAASSGWTIGSILGHLSGGVIAGMAVGYALKFACKLVLLAIGAQILFMYLLSSSGFITVNWGNIAMGLESGAHAAGCWLSGMQANLSSTMVGFAGGAIAGWRFK